MANLFHPLARAKVTVDTYTPHVPGRFWPFPAAAGEFGDRSTLPGAAGRAWSASLRQRLLTGCDGFSKPSRTRVCLCACVRVRACVCVRVCECVCVCVSV